MGELGKRVLELMRGSAEGERARWLAAVEKVRKQYPAACDVQFACDEIVRLATEPAAKAKE